MDFEYSPKVNELIDKVTAFMQDHIYPAEDAYYKYLEETDNRWASPPIMEELKAKAKECGLWNLFLAEFDEYGHGLSNLEYAPLAEITGRTPFAAEVFNCSAPDSGNMEVLARYGSDEQKKQWLIPLLNGEIRSGFCMTEPDVASSDATNIECSITREGDEYLINGRKWWTSGALHERCEIFIVMGKTNPDASRYEQQSQILVPRNTPGLTLVRPLHVFGDDDAPHGAAEITFENVRVPVGNIILGEGRGFEIAQGRLGPGRIHHCMRLVGGAQRALEMVCERAQSREAFGRLLSEQGSVREDIAKSNCEIEQARLLTLKAADKMDRYGNKEARDLIGMIKIVAPLMSQTVIDRAIQVHGGLGVCQDTVLAKQFASARTIRIADGPDQVHMNSLARQLLKRHAPA